MEKDLYHIMQEGSKKIFFPKFSEFSSVCNSLNEKQMEHEIDNIASDFFIEELHRLDSHAGVICEETTKSQSEIDYILENYKSVYILDPLDGTRNFIQKKNRCGITIGHCQDGVVEQGAIYSIFDGDYLYGGKGIGVKSNHKPLQTLIPCDSKHTVICPLNAFDDNYKDIIEGFEINFPGCASLEHMGLIKGQYDLLLQRHLSPWDQSIGVMLFQELGGIVKKSNDVEYLFSELSNDVIIFGLSDRKIEKSKMILSSYPYFKT